jgi:RimJ/RimL family protein N-acetyltransferase
MNETLRSATIVLRPLALADAAHFARLLGDDWGSIGMTGTIPYPCTEEAAREWLAQRLGKGNHMFAIVSVADREFTGSIGLHPAHAAFVLGYWVGRIHSGKGYASEAARLAVEYARTLGAVKLLAETFPENLASQRVLEKAGFVLVGTELRDLPLRGGLRLSNQYELQFN